MRLQWVALPLLLPLSISHTHKMKHNNSTEPERAEREVLERGTSQDPQRARTNCTYIMREIMRVVVRGKYVEEYRYILTLSSQLPLQLCRGDQATVTVTVEEEMEEKMEEEMEEV